jgi:hypothetical protein
MTDQPSEPRGERTGDYRVLLERDDVRQWTNENDIVPVQAEETSGPTETMLLHRENVDRGHEERDLEEFLTEFESQNLAVAYTESGSGTTDYQLVDRTQVVDEHGDVTDDVVRELLEGETVTTEIREREVVETEIVEEATIESELVDSEVVDTETVSTEILEEDLVGVAMVEDADAEVTDEAARRYVDEETDEAIAIEESGMVALEFDETRVETEEQIEEKIIESRVVASDVEETSTVEGESMDVDIDAAGIHEHLGQSGLLDVQSGDVIDEQYVETQFEEDNTATSTLTEYKTVENVIEERKVVLADVTDVHIDESALVSQEVIAADIVESGMDAVTGGQHVETDRTTAAESDAEADERRTTTAGGTVESDADVGEGRPTTERTASAGADVEISNRLMGRRVEMPDGQELGMVSDVDPDQNRLYVDREPSTTDKIKAHLHWGDEESDATLTADQIREVRSDTVVVESREPIE